jgi:hypothetical protein
MIADATCLLKGISQKRADSQTDRSGGTKDGGWGG